MINPRNLCRTDEYSLFKFAKEGVLMWQRNKPWLNLTEGMKETPSETIEFLERFLENELTPHQRFDTEEVIKDLNEEYKNNY